MPPVFCYLPVEWTHSSDMKLHQRRFSLDIGTNLITVRVVKHWSGLLSEVVSVQEAFGQRPQ